MTCPRPCCVRTPSPDESFNIEHRGGSVGVMKSWSSSICSMAPRLLRARRFAQTQSIGAVDGPRRARARTGRTPSLGEGRRGVKQTIPRHRASGRLAREQALGLRPRASREGNHEAQFEDMGGTHHRRARARCRWARVGAGQGRRRRGGGSATTAAGALYGDLYVIERDGAGVPITRNVTYTDAETRPAGHGRLRAAPGGELRPAAALGRVQCDAIRRRTDTRACSFNPELYDPCAVYATRRRDRPT